MAQDESAELLAEFVEGITFPILLDREHELSETYAITNIPTVVWIDEDGRIARPNSVAFGTDLVAEFTGIRSEPGKEAIRRWVREGVVDVTADEARTAVTDLSPADEEARLRFRIGAHLRRAGRDHEARAQFERAIELAPDDWTVWRAALPMVGEDPFGELFFEHMGAWIERGANYNGLDAIRE